MRFRSKMVEIEANQFRHGATAPMGVRNREDGSCFVLTINGQEVNVVPGDWIILENPPGDGTRAYPCKPEVFAKRWEPVADVQADGSNGVYSRPECVFHYCPYGKETCWVGCVHKAAETPGS